MMEQKELEEFIAINSLLLDLMLGEIESQSLRSKNSILQINKCLNSKQFDNQEIWNNIHAFFESSSAISRILNPTKNKNKKKADIEFSIKRGEALRSLFGINDGNVILNRNLRNRLTHIDEDIDDWYQKSERKWIAQRNISPSDSPMEGMVESEIFEHLNYKTLSVIYHGKRYSLQDMWTAIENIINELPSVQEKLRNRSKNII